MCDCCGINRNMRCIEIVLKHVFQLVVVKINRNMRCIEINFGALGQIFLGRINRNMRCIEIILSGDPLCRLLPD